jgi:N-acetylmuramoyl-L-alanine amidase
MMSAAKLLKKHEHKMSMNIKNGKHHTINMYAIYILLIPAIFIIASPVLAVPLPKNEGKWIVVIDPGHGGRDPGALGKFSKEKDINLAIALKTGKYIEDNIPNVKVLYTRKKDSTLNLYDRPAFAIKNKADLFISIHANWAKNSSITGAETYVMGVSSSEDNLEVAMKENEVILLEEDYTTKYEGFDPKSPESYIIFTLTQNVYNKQSIDLAARIQYQITERAKRKDRGVKQERFLVLYRNTMPSVLIETGFMTNTEEEKYLNSVQGQDHLASAIYRACRDYINDIDRMSGISTNTEALSEEKSIDILAMTKGEIIFMVQVASATTRTEIKPENFQGLRDITEIPSSNRFRYATGAFRNYDDAVNHRKDIETIYPDAFVIAVKDSNVLPLQQALDEKKRKK